MDTWLTNLGNDKTTDPVAVKLARARPAAAVDGCIDDKGQRVNEPASATGTGRCNQLYPVHGNPRLAAGAPLSNDVLKCQLKPLDASSYAQALTDVQLARLAAVFPGGVCDFSKPSVGSTPLIGTLD